TLYAALGPEGSKRAFVHYPAGTFPGQEKPLKDDTHFNPYGGYQLARSVVEGIRLALPDLATQLREDVGPYDPASPDPFAAVEIPPSPRASFDRPLGD
ncbi:MAG: rhamnogalacturonan acetylesterase, partial [Verrucomicrobiota bacterium]